METIFIGLKTTGSTKTDEIVEIAIISQKETLLNSFVLPTKKTSWETFHDVTPEMTVNAPTIKDLEKTIIKCTQGNEVVLYNYMVDRQQIGKGLYRPAITQDCMERFAEYYKFYNDYHKNYTWQKLGFAANHVGYKGGVGRALLAAKALQSVWDYLLINAPQKKPLDLMSEADHIENESDPYL